MPSITLCAPGVQRALSPAHAWVPMKTFPPDTALVAPAQSPASFSTPRGPVPRQAALLGRTLADGSGPPPSSKSAQLPGGSSVLTRWWGHRPRHPVAVSPCCSPSFLVSCSQHRTRSAATVQADPQPGVECSPPACRCPSYLQVVLVEPLPLAGGRRIALTSPRRQLTGCRGEPQGA